MLIPHIDHDEILDKHGRHSGQPHPDPEGNEQLKHDVSFFREDRNKPLPKIFHQGTQEMGEGTQGKEEKEKEEGEHEQEEHHHGKHLPFFSSYSCSLSLFVFVFH